MKTRLHFLFLLLLMSFHSYSQFIDDSLPEFDEYKGGFIYHDTLMNALRSMVASQSKIQCQLSNNQIYHSYPQAHAVQYRFLSKTNKLTAVLTDLRLNVEPDSLIRRYARFIDTAYSNPSFLVIQIPELSDSEYNYVGGSVTRGFRTWYELGFKRDITAKKWYFEYHERDPKDTAWAPDYFVDCIYLEKDLATITLPESAGSLVNAVDCMIDPNLKVYSKDPEYGHSGWDKSQTDISSPPLTENKEYKKLNDYLIRKMKAGYKGYPYDYLNYFRVKYAIDSLRNDSFVIQKANTIASNFIKAGKSNYCVEELTKAFVSKQLALEMMRFEPPVGNSSMDPSPRYSGLAISTLAAEVGNWDLFIHCHMDLLNDNFARNSDLSDMWHQRKLYMRELEAIGLNPTEAMIGMCLSGSDFAKGHYQGTAWRIGKAFCSSKHQQEFEEKILTLVKDEQLDDFNKIVLFLTYKNYLEDLKVS